MTNLTTLAERCEAAGGADRELDAAIALAIGWQCLRKRSRARHGLWLESGKQASEDGCQKDPPIYTASIDAALSLMPEGMGWTAGWGQTRADELMGGAVVCRNARFVGYDANYDAIASGEAATPALALTAAALRARATEKPA